MNWAAACPPAVVRCVQTLWSAGFSTYPVGGCVRDLLLGRTPSDWDLTTAAPPERVEALFDKTVPTGLAHGTVTVLLDGLSLEVTTFRGDGTYTDGRHPDAVTFGVSLQEDLARRDFTVNAMALDLRAEAVIDPFGGQADLAAKVIRAVGDPRRRFTEDALRMFRAVRFAAQLGFDLDPDTAAAIPPLAHRAGLVSRERIKAEVEKTLLSPAPERAELLLDYGLLPRAIPETPSLRFLRDVPATPDRRWRAFCRATGFDITTLPVERRLRTAVLHPERETIRALALSGGDLAALGYAGEAIGQVQLALAQHVLDHPEDNDPQTLRTLLDRLQS